MHAFKGWVEKGLAGVLEFDREAETISAITATAESDRFETGDAERNKAMEEFFDLKAHPETSFILTECRDFKVITEKRYQATIIGILEFAGIRRQLPIACSIAEQGNRILFDISLKWSFKAFGLKSPRLLFLTVRDIVNINAHLEFVSNQESV